MMIDTHCHLSNDDYINLNEVIKKMEDNIIIVSGASDKSNHEVIELCNEYTNIYGTIGIHPEEIDEYMEEYLQYIEDNINNPKIVGIGEIGLDYYHNKDDKEKQKYWFKRQLEIAKKYNKTVVIHSRDAANDTYKILKQSRLSKINIHCYSYSLELAKEYVKLGASLGIGGVVTFKNSKNLKDVVENIPLENLLLETDSPWLTPEPYRGHQNQPYNIILVAEKIAELKKISVEEVLKITTLNAVRQFDLMVK